MSGKCAGESDLMKKREWLNLPNGLTGLRIALALALLTVYFTSPPQRQLPSLCLLLAAGLTDCLDGFFARRLGQVTALGKVLDPIADKLMSAATLLCLTLSGVLPPFVLPVILARELYMAAGAAVCLKHRLEVSADIYGKLATALFYPAVLTAWPWHGVEALRSAGRVLIYISLSLSIFAAAHYTLDSVKKWRARKAR